ncbi:MAG: heavy-metal-associated domain-containing protein [Spirochaetes bacterium]|nr:heavy-metal-associated domain-containing protein [Spirochaetota bacterium]
MTTIILTTPDMSCNHCKMTIENAVKGLPGIKKVNADPGSKKVTVEYDEKSVNIEMIRSAIEDAGYSVKK